MNINNLIWFMIGIVSLCGILAAATMFILELIRNNQRLNDAYSIRTLYSGFALIGWMYLFVCLVLITITMYAYFDQQSDNCKEEFNKTHNIEDYKLEELKELQSLSC